jgi:hypothetical protein
MWLVLSRGRARCSLANAGRAFAQGIRDAHAADADGVAALLAPLEAKGILKPRSREALLEELPWCAPQASVPSYLTLSSDTVPLTSA